MIAGVEVSAVVRVVPRDVEDPAPRPGERMLWDVCGRAFCVRLVEGSWAEEPEGSDDLFDEGQRVVVPVPGAGVPGF